MWESARGSRERSVAEWEGICAPVVADPAAENCVPCA